MAEDLYELYEGLFDQQVDLAEEAVVGIVRAAFGDFSIDFKRHLRSLVPPRRRPPATSEAPSSCHQQFAEEIESARDSAQRQIATALANGFGALADLPSSLGTLASQPSISGSSTQATVGAIEANNNVDNSDDDSMSIKSEDTSECESDFESHPDEIEIKEEEAFDEIEATAIAAYVTTPNVNPNNDNVSVKTEIESGCDSSDSESTDGGEEYELAVGREIKEEIGDVLSNDQIMGNSVDENGMQVMEENQVENEIQSNDSTNDSNFEMTAHSQLVNSNLGSNEQQLDTGIIDEETTDESNNDEGDDGPTIIVVNYEEFDIQSIGSPNNQDTVSEGSLNEESDSIAEQEGEFDNNVDTANSNEDADEPLSEAVITEAISDQDQSGLPMVSNPTPTLACRSAGASRTVNYVEGMENSLAEQNDTFTGTCKGAKRTNDRSGKSNAPKRSRIDPAPAVTDVEMIDDSGEIDDPVSEAISLSIIVRRLNCTVPGCKKVFPSKDQLDDHLLVKHAIEKYACKAKDCTESFAIKGQLATHRNSAHDNLDNDWPCGQCEVICNTYKDLWQHIYHYHEYGLFACSADKCDFTENTRTKVQNHQRKHGPTKHRCTYAGCTSSFYSKSNLTLHLRVHSKERPFLCSQCPKAFAQKGNLTRHERVHSGLKPFSCTWPQCDFSASDQSHVIWHIRTVHFGLPRSKTEQLEQGIIDNRDARLFLKKTITAGN